MSSRPKRRRHTLASDQADDNSPETSSGSPDNRHLTGSDPEFGGRSSKKPKNSTSKSSSTKAVIDDRPVRTKQKRWKHWTFDKTWDLIDDLHYDATTARYDLAKAKDDAKAIATNKQSVIRQKDEKLRSLRHQTTTQRKRLKDFDTEVKALQQTIRTKEELISEFRGVKLLKLDRSDNVSDGDADIGAMLSKIFRFTKAFVRIHAASRWELLDPQAPKSTWKFLQKIPQPAIASTSYGFPAILQGLIAPNVVTNALLNHYLVRLLLAHPFAIAASFETQAINNVATAVLQRIHAASKGQVCPRSGTCALTKDRNACGGSTLPLHYC